MYLIYLLLNLIICYLYSKNGINNEITLLMPNHVQNNHYNKLIRGKISIYQSIYQIITIKNATNIYLQTFFEIK